MWMTAKLVQKLPELLPRALAGDPTAITMLVALGAGALCRALKNK